MSRSRRKTPIIGNTTSDSEKEDKQIANRKLRRKTKQAIQKGDEVLPDIKEVSDPWTMAKDGKSYRDDLDEKYLRK